ncbi:DUF4142 domain-containing protein [Amycolatopsis sp. NPDC059027]|uniref:DUF4142 domain-containing protein n=1 Tax=unclassified Amycolatopsis TaxID=2618356 RepID=UPI00366A86CA
MSGLSRIIGAFLIAVAMTCGGAATADAKTSLVPVHLAPLDPRDVGFLVALDQAGLWEGPTSGAIAERSRTPVVRSVAAQLMREHHKLAEYADAAAARLHVALPDAPSPMQRSWQVRILAAKDAEQDRLYVNLTRAAHGTVLMTIASVRSTTANDVIRSLAQVAEEYVKRHMTLLESTGLVESDSLAVRTGAAAPYQPLPTLPEALFGVALALLAGATTLVIVRRGARPESVAAEGLGVE